MLLTLTVLSAGCATTPDDGATHERGLDERKFHTRGKGITIGHPNGNAVVKAHGEVLPGGRIASCCVQVRWWLPRAEGDVRAEERGLLVQHLCLTGDGPFAHAECGCPKSCPCWTATSGGVMTLQEPVTGNR